MGIGAFVGIMAAIGLTYSLRPFTDMPDREYGLFLLLVIILPVLGASLGKNVMQALAVRDLRDFVETFLSNAIQDYVNHELTIYGTMKARFDESFRLFQLHGMSSVSNQAHLMGKCNMNHSFFEEVQRQQAAVKAVTKKANKRLELARTVSREHGWNIKLEPEIERYATPATANEQASPAPVDVTQQ